MRWQSKLFGAAVLMASLALSVGIACAQEPGEKTFATPQDASKAFYEAVKSGDKTAIMAVLGPSSAPIVSSGDEVQDKSNADFFTQHYEEMNRWAPDVNGEQTLYIGAENWPFPVPLKKDAAGTWYFDTPAGVQEVLYRRIGKNELAAIRVCGVLADAQNEYFSQTHDGDSVKQYAQKFASDPGKQNGLYWKAAEGQPESPVGPLVAYATGEGYSGKGKPQPFHGYFYRMLKAQGANVKGGAKSYIVGGKQTGGFAFVAYPAEYRNSGVMTFLVDQKGDIYEKDLGPKTAEIAAAMKSFNPDKTWRVVEQNDEDNDTGDNDQ